MNAAKFAVTFIIVVGCAIMLHRAVVAPWQINKSKKVLEQTTIALINSGNAHGAVTTIQRNLELLDSYLRLTPYDIELYMLRAANLRLVQRTDDAIRTYAASLEYDRRPEIYFNLGLVLLEAGRQDEALTNLVLAVRFRSDYLKLIQDPSIRETVAHRAGIAM